MHEKDFPTLRVGSRMVVPKEKFIGKELYRNVPGQYEMELFTSAVRYFK